MLMVPAFVLSRMGVQHFHYYTRYSFPYAHGTCLHLIAHGISAFPLRRIPLLVDLRPIFV